MARQPEPQGRTQVSVVIEDDLRRQLEAAAKHAVRSLSGEINYRLRRSLEAAGTAAA
jgi:hypothetical protein